MKNTEKRVFSCKDRCRYSRKRATFCRNFADRPSCRRPVRPRRGSEPVARHLHRRGPDLRAERRRSRLSGLAKLGKLAKFCKFLAGSFSAVSKRNFARKYAFDSIFQALQDLHPFAPLQSQNFRKNRFEKSAIFVKIVQNSAKICKCRKICNILLNLKNCSLIIL